MNKKGFTLIELLVVISIIGLLSSVVLTSLSSAKTKARIAQVQSTLKSVSAAALECDVAVYTITAGSPSTTGVTNVCSNTAGTAAKFPALPTTGGWSYDANVDATAGDGVFLFRATGDGKTITCTGSGCVTN